MTGGMAFSFPSWYNIYSVRLTKVKVFYQVLVYIFNFNLFEFSTAILEKGL